MSLFTVDETKCKKDGICAEECPIGVIINFSDKEKVPVPYEKSESLCINCGHCVAVCPHGAFTHKNLSPEDCLPVKKEMRFNPEQTEHFLRSRRAIRKYKDKEVDKKILEEIIRVASHAPSGHNIQPVRWQVIHGKDKVREMSGLVIQWMEFLLKEKPDLAKMLHLDMMVAGWKMGMDVVSRDAAALVLVNGAARDPFADNACKIAMSYLDLAIPSYGLGSCWNGYFNSAASTYKPLQEALGFPEKFTNYGALMVGYPKYKYYRMPTRNEPKISWTE